MRRLLFVLIYMSTQVIYGQKISTAKPWTYWWWMGSAVTKNDITAQLTYFEKSGLGGVHIIPIYGVKGYENKSIPFLNADWIDIMQFTVREGKRLGIGVDMTTGTGWPFGGPNVSPAIAAKSMSVDGVKFVIEPTNQKVKRSAPGGEGLVLDPFHPKAMSSYLSRFDSAFANVRDRPRSMYNDSYEAYGANWTVDFEEQFNKRRGYSLKDVLRFFTDTTRNIEADRVRIDYHQTLAELLRERYAHPWTQWSRERGFLTRYQAHGSPGNLLDLYGEADIPETESFGTSRFEIPGLRIDPDYSIDQFGTPNPLAMKFASSAAHFYCKKLVSSETGTWLANHFKVSLSQIKPQIDELFTAGVNHIFYHGTTYSPSSEPYPGWLFYASTNFGSSSHFAGQFSLLNKYVQQCQERLQQGRPDNDVLVYFPIHDLWATPGKSAGGVHLLEVHHVDRWLLELPFGKLTAKLWKEGYSFDYASDLQIGKLRVGKNGELSSGHAVYKALLIPSSTYMPQETQKHLISLAKAGARIVFENNLPSRVTGYVLGEKRQKVFNGEMKALEKMAGVSVTDDWREALGKYGAGPETLSQKGLTFIRKKGVDGQPYYFISNLGNTFKEDWITLNSTGVYEKFDPMAGTSQIASRKARDKREFFLSLAPGQSCFLNPIAGSAEVPFVKNEYQELPITGEWKFKFLNGRPAFSEIFKLNALDSWTLLSDSAEYFSGTASYETTFSVPEHILADKTFKLNLGDVREVASVKINGQHVGTAWCIPFELTIPSLLLKTKENLLEVEVTNLSANYMRLRDRQVPDWKKFYDINIVDITYKKFDALNWKPMPSGLLTPVKLVYY
ncbi:glycosyl hydrolase [Dyadobacter bucti]|uniref:glycosyl hydrolase n=1 Tax=Dyadobacter bucti TaxID=2572203 RepID=UPI003F722DAB